MMEHSCDAGKIALIFWGIALGIAFLIFIFHMGVAQGEVDAALKTLEEDGKKDEK